MSALAPSLEAFFTDRLVGQRAASQNTIAAYALTFWLLLGFVSARSGIPPSRLDSAQLDAPLVAAFLEHLERERGNTAATRNARLAAIHSLFSYMALHHPEHAGSIRPVLAIPNKRTEVNLVTYLSEDEATALLAACDQRRWTGRRALLNERAGAPNDPLFATSTGRRLSRDAVEHRLAHHVALAQRICPSIGAKRITMHTLRHTAAMRQFGRRRAGEHGAAGCWARAVVDDARPLHPTDGRTTRPACCVRSTTSRTARVTMTAPQSPCRSHEGHGAFLVPIRAQPAGSPIPDTTKRSSWPMNANGAAWGHDHDGRAPTFLGRGALRLRRRRAGRDR